MRKKPSGVHVIDMKRAHNISIQLSSLRKPFLELCKALQEIDEGILTNDTLNVLYRTLPTKEDISNLKDYQGDPLQLAEVEKYYLEIMSIPRVDKKIKVLNFKSQSSLLIQQIKEDLLLLQHACVDLKESEKFVKLLEAVLVVGNYLNGDSSRGNARGFKLDALLKLMDVKGSNRQTTLLHFVVVELVKVDEQILSLPDELKSVKLASSVKLESIFMSINDLERGLEITEEEIEFARADLSNLPSLRSRFLDSMLPFFEDCSVHVVELKELLKVSLEKLKHVSEYFGESSKEEPPRQMDLFRTMHQFLNMFQQVSKEIQEGRSSLKVEQSNGTPLFRRKVKSSGDSRAASLVPMGSADNRGKLDVIENLTHLSKNSDSPGLLCGNDGTEIECGIKEKVCSIASRCTDSGSRKKDQQTASYIEEIMAKEERATEALLAQLPSKSMAPHILGYDSDWSTG